MGRIISIANQKGGVAKSTVSFNLAHSLSRAGKKVLLIDLDPQHSLTSILKAPQTYTINHILHGDKVKVLKGKAFDFIPSSLDLASFDITMSSDKRRNYKLQEAIGTVMGDYDYILIDCPPALNLLTTNALVASHGIIVPMSCEFLSWDGYEKLLGIIDMAQKVNPVEIMGIVATMYDSRKHHNRDILAAIQQEKHFQTVLSDSVSYPNSSYKGVPIWEVDKKLGKQFESFTKEVMEYGKH